MKDKASSKILVETVEPAVWNVIVLILAQYVKTMHILIPRVSVSVMRDFSWIPSLVSSVKIRAPRALVLTNA